MEEMRILVPRAVYEGLEAVRGLGYVNMFAHNGVADLASTMGHEETAEWMRSNLGAYVKGLLHGFACEDKT